MTAFVCWEDAIAPTDLSDVIADREAALAEQRAAIQAMRAEIAESNADAVTRGVRAYYQRSANGWDAERIRALRDRHGLTQTGLAKRLGCAQQSVQTWEAGETRPKRSLAERLDELDREPVVVPEPKPVIAPRWDADRVLQLRMRISVTQRELGELVGLDHSNVALWERGERVPIDRHQVRLDEIDRSYPTVEPLTGRGVRAIRQRAGWTQAQLGRELGIRPNHVSQIECGTKAIGLRMTRAIRRLETLIDKRMRDEVAA